MRKTERIVLLHVEFESNSVANSAEYKLFSNESAVNIFSSTSRTNG